MNMPIDQGLRQVTLDDKYDATEGRVYLTGTQALVRLPLMQRQRDLAAGLNTAGYISGYRGSPVGGYDQALWRARKQLEAHLGKLRPTGFVEKISCQSHSQHEVHSCQSSAAQDSATTMRSGSGPA